MASIIMNRLLKPDRLNLDPKLSYSRERMEALEHLTISLQSVELNQLLISSEPLSTSYHTIYLTT